MLRKPQNVVLEEIFDGDGRRCKLSAVQAALLACLSRKAGTPVSRDELLEQVWHLDPRRTRTRRIDMHISLLRRKLGDTAEAPRVLLKVYGVGYMLHQRALSSLLARALEEECRPNPDQVTRGVESLSIPR